MTATTNDGYTLIGNVLVVPAAELASLTAVINVYKGDVRKGGNATGKVAGKRVWADQGNGTYKLYIALGPLAADKWQLVSGASQVTPA